MDSDRDALATLATVSNEVEAQLLVNLLEEHGIVSTAIGGFTSDFRAEAPGAVRVVVKQDNLAAAESVLAKREPYDSSSEPMDDDQESTAYPPKLTRFCIWTMLLWDLLSFAIFLVYWVLGGDLLAGLVALIVSALIGAAILTRRWSDAQ